MSETYQVAVLRDRTEMLEAQLDVANKRIRDLESDFTITEKTVMRQAARKFSTADIILSVNRVHDRKPDKPFGESAEYRLTINGVMSPIVLYGTDLGEISKQLE